MTVKNTCRSARTGAVSGQSSDVCCMKVLIFIVEWCAITKMVHDASIFLS